MNKINWDNFKLECNDIRALLTITNVILITHFGLSVAWIGLLIALFGIVKDFTVDKKLSGLIIHVANAILNIYFLLL